MFKIQQNLMFDKTGVKKKQETPNRLNFLDYLSKEPVYVIWITTMTTFCHNDYVIVCNLSIPNDYISFQIKLNLVIPIRNVLRLPENDNAS